MNKNIKEVKTVKDTMTERLGKLDKLIENDQFKLEVKEIALRKSLKAFHEALEDERENISVRTVDMMRQFLDMDFNKLLCAGVRVPVFEEQIGCRKYVMFVHFYETEKGADLFMDITRFDADTMTTYRYDTEKEEWETQHTPADMQKDMYTAEKTGNEMVRLLVEAKEKGDMTEQAYHEFLYGDHKSKYGTDMRGFALSVRPLIILANHLSGIARIKILKDGQTAIVPLDAMHKGICVTYERDRYCVNNYYTDDMVLEDGTLAEKDKYFILQNAYKTKDISAAAAELRDAVQARAGIMHPVTYVVKRGVIVTVPEAGIDRMIDDLHMKVEEAVREKEKTKNPITKKDIDKEINYMQALATTIGQ